MNRPPIIDFMEALQREICAVCKQPTKGTVAEYDGDTVHIQVCEKCFPDFKSDVREIVKQGRAGSAVLHSTDNPPQREKEE